jgi:tetratricopeptide (TPR) repeat protein
MMSVQILQPLLDDSDVKNSFIISNVLSNTVDVNTDQLLTEAFECVEDGNHADALKLYGLILRHDPTNIRALVDKGVTLHKALSISPDNIDAWINKGSALHSDQKYLDAIDCYDAVLSIDKKCTMALAYKGLSLGEMDNLQEAIKYFKKALSIDKYHDLANISKQTAQDLLKLIKKNKSKIQ